MPQDQGVLDALDKVAPIAPSQPKPKSGTSSIQDALDRVAPLQPPATQTPATQSGTNKPAPRFVGPTLGQAGIEGKTVSTAKPVQSLEDEFNSYILEAKARDPQSVEPTHPSTPPSILGQLGAALKAPFGGDAGIAAISGLANRPLLGTGGFGSQAEVDAYNNRNLAAPVAPGPNEEGMGANPALPYGKVGFSPAIQATAEGVQSLATPANVALGVAAPEIADLPFGKAALSGAGVYFGVSQAQEAMKLKAQADELEATAKLQDAAGNKVAAQHTRQQADYIRTREYLAAGMTAAIAAGEAKGLSDVIDTRGAKANEAAGAAQAKAMSAEEAAKARPVMDAQDEMASEAGRQADFEAAQPHPPTIPGQPAAQPIYQSPKVSEQAPPGQTAPGQGYSPDSANAAPSAQARYHGEDTNMPAAVPPPGPQALEQVATPTTAVDAGSRPTYTKAIEDGGMKDYLEAKYALPAAPVNPNEPAQLTAPTSPATVDSRQVNIQTPDGVMRPAPEPSTGEKTITPTPDNTPDEMPEVDHIVKTANAYNKKVGLKPLTHEPITVDENKSQKIADFYDANKSIHNNPAVKSAYETFNDETAAQFKHLTKAGYKFEPTDNQTPYTSAADMAKDLRDNKHLFVWSGGSPGHGLMTQEQNFQFRAVHDTLGHVGAGANLGHYGEETAYHAHKQMYTPEAQKAMATETRGQNAAVHFSSELKNPKGEMYSPKADVGYKFPEQKAMILPESLRERRQAPKSDSALIDKFVKSGAGRVVDHTTFKPYDRTNNPVFITPNGNMVSVPEHASALSKAGFGNDMPQALASNDLARVQIGRNQIAVDLASAPTEGHIDAISKIREQDPYAMFAWELGDKGAAPVQGRGTYDEFSQALGKTYGVSGYNKQGGVQPQAQPSPRTFEYRNGPNGPIIYASPKAYDTVKRHVPGFASEGGTDKTWKDPGLLAQRLREGHYNKPGVADLVHELDKARYDMKPGEAISIVQQRPGVESNPMANQSSRDALKETIGSRRHEDVHKRLEDAGINAPLAPASTAAVKIRNYLEHAGYDLSPREPGHSMDHDTFMHEALAHVAEGSRTIAQMGLTNQEAASIIRYYKSQFEIQIGPHGVKDVFARVAPGAPREEVYGKPNQPAASEAQPGRPADLGQPLQTNAVGQRGANVEGVEQPNANTTSTTVAATPEQHLAALANAGSKLFKDNGYLTFSSKVRGALSPQQANSADLTFTKPLWDIMSKGVAPKEALRYVRPETANDTNDIAKLFSEDPDVRAKVDELLKSKGSSLEATENKSVHPREETNDSKFTSRFTKGLENHIGQVRDSRIANKAEKQKAKDQGLGQTRMFEKKPINPLPNSPEYTKIHEGQNDTKPLTVNGAIAKLVNYGQATKLALTRGVMDKWVDVRNVVDAAKEAGINIPAEKDPYIGLQIGFGGGNGGFAATMLDTMDIFHEAEGKQLGPQTLARLNLAANQRAIDVIKEKEADARAAGDTRTANDYATKLANGEVAAGGYTEPKIASDLKDLEASVTPAQWADVQKMAAKEFQLNRDALDYWHDRGRMSDATYAKLIARGPEYVTMSRILDDAENSGYGTPGGIAMSVKKSQGIASLEGSELINQNPWIADPIRRGMLYREDARMAPVEQLHGLAKANPAFFKDIVHEVTPRTPVGKGQGEIAYLKDSKQVKLAVPEALAEAYKVASTYDTKILFQSLLQKTAAPYRASMTGINMAYAATSPLRELFDTVSMSPRSVADAPSLVAHQVEALGHIIKKDQVYRDALRAGVAYTSIQSRIDPLAVIRDQSVRGLASPGTPIRNKLFAVTDTIGNANEALQLMSKMGARQMYIDQGMSPVAATARARQFSGRPDVANAGTWTSQLNPLLLFFVDKMKGAQRSWSFAKIAPKALAVTVMAHALGELALNRYNSQFTNPDDGDQEWNHVSENDKKNYYVFLTPHQIENSDGSTRLFYLKVPRGRFVAGQAMRDMWGYTFGQDDKMQSMLNELSDFIPGDYKLHGGTMVSDAARGFASSIHPLIQEPVEQLSNRDTYTGNKIVPDSLSEGVAPKYQYDTRTSEIGKRIGAVMNISPKRLDHVIRGTGGAVESLLSPVNFALNKADPKRSYPYEGPEAWTKWPFVGPFIRSFLGSPVDQVTSDADKAFYNMRDEAKIADGTLDKVIQEPGKFDAIREEYLKDPRKLVLADAYPDFVEATKKLADMRSELQTNLESKTMPQGDKKYAAKLTRDDAKEFMKLPKMYEEMIPAYAALSREQKQAVLDDILNRKRNLNIPPEETDAEK